MQTYLNVNIIIKIIKNSTIKLCLSVMASSLNNFIKIILTSYDLTSSSHHLSRRFIISNYIKIGVDASRQFDHPSQRRSCAPKACRLGWCEEGYTSSVWLENESILIEIPKVSEVATIHWIFSKVWLVTWLYLILLPILG